MIIVRSPLRITLGGGGTDLPSYYEQHAGFCVSAAINKYIYVAVHKTFQPGWIIKYSKTETVMNVQDIQHPIIKAALKRFYIGKDSLEINSMADIPAGTGLGSSSCFTVALVQALLLTSKKLITHDLLSQYACAIELEDLKEPIGKQDQYASAFGGVRALTFNQDHSVNIKSLNISKNTFDTLEGNLLLFFTGHIRSASSILSDQNQKSQQNNQHMLQNLDMVKSYGYESKRLLESGDLVSFAKLMNMQWKKKQERSKNMSNEKVNQIYDYAMNHGALGGKLIGAGGGGFLMFYTDNVRLFREAMQHTGLSEVPFRFDMLGALPITYN